MKKRIITLCFVLALCLTLCACGESSSGEKKSSISYISQSVNGMVDDDGTVYFPTFTAESLKIDGDAFAAKLSPDRTKAVVLEWDGTITLYPDCTDLNQQVVITQDGNALGSIWDSGFLYTDSDDVYYRYTFAENDAVKLGDIDDLYINNSYDLSYAVDGKIYLVKNDAAEAVKIGSYDSKKSVDILCISPDGSKAVWSVADSDGNYDIYVYESETDGKEKIGSMEISSSYGSVSAVYNDSSSCLIAYSMYSDVLFVKPLGQESIKVRLGNDCDGGCYTAEGLFRWDSGKDFTGIYVLVEADSNSSLYYIDADGEREKLLSDIDDYAVSDGYLYYTDGDSTLYYAEIKDTALEEPVKISGDVADFTIPTGGSIVFYLKNLENTEGTLYAYERGSESSEKISSGVYAYTIYGITISSFGVCSDYKTVYYYKDVEQDVGNTYNDIGTLYLYTYGSESSTKISSDAVVFSEDSATFPSFLDKSSFTYEKYQTSGGTYHSDDAIYVNLVYYNGSDSSVIAKDVLED